MRQIVLDLGGADNGAWELVQGASMALQAEAALSFLRGVRVIPVRCWLVQFSAWGWFRHCERPHLQVLYRRCREIESFCWIAVQIWHPARGNTSNLHCWVQRMPLG